MSNSKEVFSFLCRCITATGTELAAAYRDAGERMSESDTPEAREANRRAMRLIDAIGKYRFADWDTLLERAMA